MIKVKNIDGIKIANCPLCKSPTDITDVVAQMENSNITQINEGVVLEKCGRCRNNTIVGRLEAMKRSWKVIDPDCVVKKEETKIYNPEISESEFVG